MGTDVGDDRRDVRTAIRRPATDYEDPDRLVEFTDALAAAVELQLGMERGLEEAVHDFVVAEARSLGCVPNADVGIVGLCRTMQGSADHDCGRGEDHAGVGGGNDRILQSAIEHNRLPAFALAKGWCKACTRANMQATAYEFEIEASR